MIKQWMAFLSAAILLIAAAGCNAQADAAEAGETPGAVLAAPESAPEEAAGPDEREEQPEAEEEKEPEFDNDWEFDLPENHGMDGEALDRLHTALAAVDIFSAVTAKDGVIIDEYYKEGYDENSVFPLHSCSKSFTGALVGLAIDQGRINGVDDLLSQYLPQLADYADDDPRQQITLEHLLTHTSGLEWYEWGGNSSSWRPFQEAENWVDYVLSRSMAAQPGAHFAYSTGGSHLLTAALQEAIGQTALAYGQEYVFGPMGMDSVEWRADAQGVIDGGNGIAMTARDAAKFGQLYLDGGQWRGRRILPAGWVETSVERKIPGADNAAAYGYQWWIRSCGAANYETYYAMGAGGQFIFVVPELDLVTVMTSRSQDTYAPRGFFMDYVLAAYTER